MSSRNAARCIGGIPARNSASPNRFAILHFDGRHLIQGWYERARAAHGKGGDSFEPFIYLWIAFNGWAACVTGRDHDPEWQKALARDERLRTDFEAIMARSEAFEIAAREFAAWWPIFRVDELRGLPLDHWQPPDVDRRLLTAEFINAGARRYEPVCWPEHERRGDSPVDWPHTLAALYRVRCNLFHGEKSRSSENDHAVVTRAFDVLSRFLGETEYLA
jgi:hypothetical protein